MQLPAQYWDSLQHTVSMTPYDFCLYHFTHLFIASKQRTNFDLISSVGQTIMSRLLAKSKRNSYIAFSIGFVVLLSALLMTLESVLHLVSEEENDEFGGICDSHLNGHHT